MLVDAPLPSQAPSISRYKTILGTGNNKMAADELLAEEAPPPAEEPEQQEAVSSFFAEADEVCKKAWPRAREETRHDTCLRVHRCSS